MSNKFYTYKYTDCLSSSDLKNALHNIYNDFVVVPTDKATENITVVCKRFYASVIGRKSGSANDIIDKNIRDLKIKFGIDNNPIENHRLPYVYWVSKMHKKFIKARFKKSSPMSSSKPLTRTAKSNSLFGF